MTTAIGTYATRAKVTARMSTDVTLTAAELVLIDDLCNEINAWVESETGRVLAPLTDTTITLDGLMADDCGRRLPIPWGINSLTSLQVLRTATGAWETIASTDWLLRPTAIARKPGWPATHIVMTDVQQGTVLNRIPLGHANVKLTGSAGFLGWPAIPSEIEGLAVSAVIAAWSARVAGQTEILGTDEFGRPIVSTFVSRRNRGILARYDIRPQASGGTPVVWGG